MRSASVKSSKADNTADIEKEEYIPPNNITKDFDETVDV